MTRLEKEQGRLSKKQDAAKEMEVPDAIRIRNAEWILERMKADQLPIYTMDIETDPFKRDVVPQPFVVGIYDGLVYYRFWNDTTQGGLTCIEKAKQFLEDGILDPGIVYMHNGGRFDFFFFIDWFEGKTMIIGSRIVTAFMQIGNTKSKSVKENRFEFRDSYAIMPFPLKAYMKDELPLEFLLKENRYQNVDAIESYLYGDCFYLWELCMEFQREFGDRKTIASAAFAELTKFHNYDQLPKNQDTELRDKFYFGGRVQCFQNGVIEKPIEIYDVNSMYPFVMDTYYHPVGWCNIIDGKLRGWNPDGTFNRDKLKTFFLTVEGRNDGAFPIREKDGSVEFTKATGVFHVSIHEYLVAKELGLFDGRILSTYNFGDYSRFHLFVDHFYKKREIAKQNEDKMHSLFYKYILNSAYGKFGLNPDNYFNWKITKDATQPTGPFWEIDQIVQDKYFIWKQPNQTPWNIKNIGTAASITGAARSVLLRAIAISRNVLYCDTDSIICEALSGGEIDAKKLGAWKSEGSGVRAAIAGKKMYAIFDASGECIKHAAKGVDLKPAEIMRLAQGEQVMTFRDAPTFKRDGSATFISRKVRMTA